VALRMVDTGDAVDVSGTCWRLTHAILIVTLLSITRPVEAARLNIAIVLFGNCE
jgi:hypothetical protein